MQGLRRAEEGHLRGERKTGHRRRETEPVELPASPVETLAQLRVAWKNALS